MDSFSQRAAVVGLILIAVASVASCVALSFSGESHSPGLCQLAATCAGALAGLAWPHQRPAPPANGSR